MEAGGLGSCDDAMTKVHDISSPLSAPPDRLTGTVCLGPLKDRSRSAGCTPTRRTTGCRKPLWPMARRFRSGCCRPTATTPACAIKTTSLSAWRADGTPVTKAQLGDPAAFAGNGYMLLGLQADAIAARYRDDSAARGGPMMLVASPTLPGSGTESGLRGVRMRRY